MDWKQSLEQYGFTGFGTDDSDIAVWLKDELGELHPALQVAFEEALLNLMKDKNPIIAKDGFENCMIFLSAFKSNPAVWHYFFFHIIPALKAEVGKSQ